MKLIAATYNIHRCIGTDGRRDTERVCKVLREIAPDIIALQEVESRYETRQNNLEFLAHQTGLHPTPGPTILSEEGEYGNAILAKQPPLSVRHIDLSYPGREPRGAIETDFDFEGRKVRAITTHLGLRPFERRDQVQRLLAVLAERGDASVTLLMGDINEWFLWGRPLRWLHKYFGFTKHIRTFPAQAPLLTLDRIWCHPRENLIQLGAHRSDLSRAASDHLPLAGVIVL